MEFKYVWLKHLDDTIEVVERGGTIRGSRA